MRLAPADALDQHSLSDVAYRTSHRWPVGAREIAARGPGIEEAGNEPVENWYAEHLGSREPSRAVVLRGRVSSRVPFGWAIFPGDEPRDARLEAGDEGIEAVVGGRRVPMGAPLSAESPP